VLRGREHEGGGLGGRILASRESSLTIGALSILLLLRGLLGGVQSALELFCGIESLDKAFGWGGISRLSKVLALENTPVLSRLLCWLVSWLLKW